jgi:signal transduction histidine kinase
LPALAGWLLVHARAGAQGDSVALALLVMGTSVPMFYLLLEYARKGELLHIAQEAQAGAQQRHALLLEQEVARITAELAGMHRRELDDVAQLERARRSEVIAQLTGSIAHDFNNLLMVIGGSAQLMKLQLPPASKLLRHVDKITSTVSATAKLTAQLAAFSGTQKLESAPLLIDDMVRAAIADNLALLPPNIRFEQQLNAAGAWVMGDRSQLQIAVGHLLRNAGEALAGYGTVAITTRIAPSDSSEGNDSVVISVQDDGAGMSEAVMKNATEPFFTTKQATKHQGLGLAQASSVLHQASGSLQLAAGPGKGSRVEMYLPRHAPLANQVGQPGPADLHALAGERNRRLLVIDDDDDVRTVIAELLRALQYDVTEASDGETGLRKLHEMQPALAIIDYLMPGMNGGEVARKARQQMPSLPILFISGYADSDAIAAIPHAHLLRKPILPRELERAVNGALS